MRDFFAKGLRIGPHETVEGFLKRIEQLQISTSKDSHSLPKEALDRVAIFGVNPVWITFVRDSKGLLPWEPAATWIENSLPCIQIKKLSLWHKLFGYSEGEILSHEAVHAMRAAFDEPAFEEYLAYQTSSKSYRRVLGPLFSSSTNSLLFLLFILGISCMIAFSTWEMWSYSIFFGLATFVSYYFSKKYRLFKKSLQNIQKTFPNQAALGIALSLTDQEIISFSKLSRDRIKKYAMKNSADSPRWQQILQMIKN